MDPTMDFHNREDTYGTGFYPVPHAFSAEYSGTDSYDFAPAATHNQVIPDMYISYADDSANKENEHPLDPYAHNSSMDIESYSDEQYMQENTDPFQTQSYESALRHTYSAQYGSGHGFFSQPYSHTLIDHDSMVPGKILISNPPTPLDHTLLNSSFHNSNVDSSSPYQGSPQGFPSSDSALLSIETGEATYARYSAGSSPFTPTGLHLEGLTLGLSPSPDQGSPNVRSARSSTPSVRYMSLSRLQPAFPGIEPLDLVVVFNKSKQMLKVNAYQLCLESPYFNELLRQYLPRAQTVRCVRLRGDFPYAVSSLFHLIETGEYCYKPQTLVDFPFINWMDLHLHAYFVGTKYGVLRLRDVAMAGFIDLASMVLDLSKHVATSSMPISRQSLQSNISMEMNLSDSTPSLPAPEQPHPDDDIGMFDRLLDALVLLWKHTPDKQDPLRAEIIEMLKYHLRDLLRIPFFTTMLLEMQEFRDDILTSLAEDGFDITVLASAPELRRMPGITFQTINTTF